MTKTKVAQASFWTTNLALAAAVKARAKHRGQTVSAALEEAFTAWLSGAGATPAVGEPVAEPGCRRCGHRAGQHWARGCVVGCVCGRYVET
jgi:hypothetical protein